MTERRDLLASVAGTIQSYRQGEVAAITPDHVDRWLGQFSPATELSFLREIDHVLKQTFITLDTVKTFLTNLSTDRGIAGTSPIEYWKSANFLKIQQNGRSQVEMLRLFGECLVAHGVDIAQCGSPEGPFIYLDDILFSGGRVRTDLADWIQESAPTESTVHVIVAVSHLGGEYYTQKKLKEVARAAGKRLDLNIWRLLPYEDRKWCKNSSNILWPVVTPNNAYVNSFLEAPNKYPLDPRVASATVCQPFSSEAGRQLLEAEFLIAGAKIWSGCDEPSKVLRPLGYSRFGVGFGSMIATYRNCPNNCPLALWWGDASVRQGPLCWYPLLPRATYSQSAILHEFEAIELE